MTVGVRPLAPRERGRASEVLTEAFTDDPVWRAIGPDRRRHRRLVQRGWFTTALWCAARWGNPTRAAVRGQEGDSVAGRVSDPGRVDGVAVCFDSEDYPPPALGEWLANAPLALAGPAPVARAMRVDAAMAGSHPREPHLYLWLLAAHPDAQRRGVGRALLQDVAREADERELPVYLETFTPANVPYYASFGFGIDEVHEDVVRGATLWRMTRPARP